ncbi:MAG: hypothetical protein ACKO8H_06875 [Microcystis panniformis]
MKILTCYSLSKHFSTLFFRLQAFRTIRSIEKHYRLTKRFQDKSAPSSLNAQKDKNDR